MVIAVTGAAGRVGGFVVDELIQSGHDVVAVDLREPLVAATETRRADIQDLATLADALRGCEAIVHLAAIAEEGLAPPDFTFAVNAQGTVNCLEAAVKGRARKFVYASSEAVLGFAYRTRDLKPDYFPIDEEHPLRPQDSYGMSKIAAEEACRAYARRGSLETVCIRPCYCWGPRNSATRRSRRFETRTSTTSRSGSTSTCATSRACTAWRPRVPAPSTTVYAVAPDIRAPVETAELIERFYPGVPLRREMGPNDSLISGDRAREVFGFEPKRSWRDEVALERVT